MIHSSKLQAENLAIGITQEGTPTFLPKPVYYLQQNGYQIEGIEEAHTVHRGDSDTGHMVLKVETYQYPRNDPRLDVAAHKGTLTVCDCKDYLYRKFPDLSEDNSPFDAGECVHIESLDEKYECEECTRRFDTEAGLSRHKGHGHAVYMDPELLGDLYWVKSMSTHEIADELDTDAGTISEWMKHFGIMRRSKTAAKGGYEFTKEELENLYYEKGLSTVQIGEMYGVDNSNVSRRMERLGLDRRDGFQAAPSWVQEIPDKFGENWQEQREERLSKDNYECVVCGKSNKEHKEEHGRALHVHHIAPRSSFVIDGELDFEEANRIDNLITLCYGCHFKWEGIPLRPQVQKAKNDEQQDTL